MREDTVCAAGSRTSSEKQARTHARGVVHPDKQGRHIQTACTDRPACVKVEMKGEFFDAINQ